MSSNTQIQSKTLSSHLQELIDVANKSIQTIKEQIVEIYETAKNEGFTPMEARALIEVKVLKISQRYLRLLLPDEAKDQSKVRHSNNNNNNGEDDESDLELETPQDFAEQVPQIPAPKTEIKDAESEELKDLPEPEDSDPEPGTQDETRILNEQIQIQNLQVRLSKLEQENTELRMAKVGTYGNKIEFEYDFEMPSGSIIPFIITCFPDKKTGYIRLNKPKIEENEKKEVKKR